MNEQELELVAEHAVAEPTNVITIVDDEKLGAVRIAHDAPPGHGNDRVVVRPPAIRIKGKDSSGAFPTKAAAGLASPTAQSSGLRFASTP